MKSIGMIVGAISALCLLITLNMSTSYDGVFNNLHLMQDKQNYVTVSSLGVLVGLALFFFSEKKFINESEKGTVVNHHSNFELSKKTIHRFEESEKNLENDAFKLYLVEKYKISKNEVLNKFVLENKLYENLAEVLNAAMILEVAKDIYNNRFNNSGYLKNNLKNSLNTADAALKFLEGKGYIISVEKNKSSNGKFSNKYLLNSNGTISVKYSDEELVNYVNSVY